MSEGLHLLASVVEAHHNKDLENISLPITPVVHSDPHPEHSLPSSPPKEPPSQDEPPRITPKKRTRSFRWLFKLRQTGARNLVVPPKVTMEKKVNMRSFPKKEHKKRKAPKSRAVPSLHDSVDEWWGGL